VSGLLLGILQNARCGDVGDVVAVELHEGELEDETHEVVEVSGIESLWVEHLLEAAFGHTVVAAVELEGWTAVLDDVAVDVNAGFEMVQFVLPFVEFEYLGRDTFVGGHKVQVDAFAAEFRE
jgi:hypothetical protein